MTRTIAVLIASGLLPLSALAEDPAPAVTAAPAAAPAAAATPAAAQSIVITAARRPLPADAAPVWVRVLDARARDAAAATTTDGVLRGDPSVALFRRSSSIAADPSSQGMNLRGIGPSAVSRALVLLDGVPVNDGFGGWIPWRALPRLGIERAEIAPGGASALYGNQALGGVVHLLSPPIEPGVEADLLGGSRDTRLAAVRAAHRATRVGVALDADWLETAGYVPVAPEQRGSVDRAGASRHAQVSGTALALPGRAAVRVRGAWFDETLDGGTRHTHAGIARGEASVRVDAPVPGGTLELTGALRTQLFTQARARIAEDRSSEERAARQRVPSQEALAAAVWALDERGGHRLSLGLDARAVRGVSEETLFPPAVDPDTVVARDAGGAQRFAGVFVQDLWAVTPRIQVSGSLRGDVWEDRDGSRRLERGDGSATTTTFDPRTAWAWSPRVATRIAATDRLAVRAAAHRSFRAPTLNELYRPFQVGTVRTAANEALRAETLVGGEAGLDLRLGPGATARTTAFWNELRDPIVNVTLPEPLPDGSQRQRRNLGAARIQGLETALELAPASTWRLRAAWTLADARVVSHPADRTLEGKRLPQDPLHRLSASAAWDDPRFFAAAIEVRHLSRQFEDDRNEVPLGDVTLVDVTASRALWRGLEARVSVENLLDRQYLVGRAGVDTVGAPRTVLVGLRLRR